MGEKCEECDQYGKDVFRRAEHGKTLCNGCNQDQLRDITPTNLIPRYLDILRANSKKSKRRKWFLF